MIARTRWREALPQNAGRYAADADAALRHVMASPTPICTCRTRVFYEHAAINYHGALIVASARAASFRP